MGFSSIWHWVIVLLIVLILFGRGRIAEMMGDFGKGIKSFKQGMSDEENKPVPPPPAQLQQQAPPPPAPAATAQPTTTDQAQ